jgi:hypothetical protein
MLLVFPVTGADYQLADITSKLVVQLGGVRPHPILAVFAASCPADARKKIERTLVSATDRLFVHELETKDERGWPRSANSVFAEVARVVFDNKGYGEKCWYFFEADNTPMRPNWATLLEREYLLARMPYMGVKHVTHRGVGPARREAGFHMVGTGIYPADFFQSCRMAKHITSVVDPFDVAIQWEVVPKMHHTDQIFHNWSSHKYTLNAKKREITCRAFREGVGIANPIPLDHLFSVVHGCKDGSLAKLVSADIPL